MTKKNQEQYNRLERFLNMTSRSGYVNLKPVISEMARLIGLCPKRVINSVRTISQ